MTICALYSSADSSVDCATFRSSYSTANGTTARSWVHSFLMIFDDYANILRPIDLFTVLLGRWQGGSLITPACRRQSSHLVTWMLLHPPVNSCMQPEPLRRQCQACRRCRDLSIFYSLSVLLTFCSLHCLPDRSFFCFSTAFTTVCMPIA